MPRFIGSRENSLEDALNIGAYGRGGRRYFHVVDFDGHHDTEVLVAMTDEGVKVALPDYTQTGEDARRLLTDPDPEEIKTATLDLIRTHATALSV